MQKLIKECIFENYSDQEVNAALSRIPSFNTDLAKLITSIVSHHLPNWRREVKSHQISLPKLEEFDWRVDIKSASDLIGQISVPTVLVAMKASIYGRTHIIISLHVVNINFFFFYFWNV